MGLIFLFMLFIPNLIWIKHKPKDYEKYEKNENKILLCFEKVGQISVISISLTFTDFNIKPITPWSRFLGIASFIMLLYEGYWIRYFKSDKTMKDFYTSFLGIPSWSNSPYFCLPDASNLWKKCISYPCCSDFRNWTYRDTLSS